MASVVEVCVMCGGADVCLVGRDRSCDVAHDCHVLIVCVFVCLCAVVISLRGNGIGDQVFAAIGPGLHGVPSLTSLKYVMQAWVMCMMGSG
jgi:hypothetical protein